MTETQASAGAPTAGSLLREARERQGIHIGALAAAIKVTPRKLDALENDRWHELPDATFARALAQTVCRTLKIDAAPILALLPATGQVALEPASNADHQPFRDRPGRADPGFGGNAIRPMLWAAGALMVAAVAVYFVPPDLLSPSATVAQAPVAGQPPSPAGDPTTLAQPGENAAPGATAAALPGALGSAPPGMEPTPAPDGLATAGATPVSVGGLPAASLPLSAQPLQAATPGAAPAVAAALPSTSALSPVPAVSAVAVPLPTVPGPANTPAPSPVQASGAKLLQLSSSAPSWVEVRDAAGELLLSRTLLPGESVGVNGALPMRLTIGNAAATQIAFKGQALDLAPRTRENVARFEVQ